MAKIKRTAPAPTTNGKRSALKTMASALVARQKLAASLGQSYDGERDLYDALGYDLTLTFQQYFGRYSRQDISKRIVEAFPDATWRGRPSVYSPEAGEEDAFMQEWDKLAREHRIYHYFNRVDTLAGIGEYAVLLMGFQEPGPVDMEQPVERASKLLYLAPYSQQNAEVAEIDEDPTSPRYGLPHIYKINMAMETSTQARKDRAGTTLTRSRRVHWTRVLHVAEGLLEDEIYGTPRLKAVFNRLEDMARVVGGSGEMFWKGAFPGYAFMAKEGADWDDQTIDEFTDELEEYFHGLRRFLRLSETEIKDMAMQVADPSKHVDVYLTLISGATGIPKRILTGSEAGELASSQDENNWNSRVEERRIDFAEPAILRPFINRLGTVGILNVPEDFVVDWPDMQALPEKDQADIGLVRAKTLKEYMTSGAEMILPPEVFLTRILNVPEEDVQGIMDATLAMIEEDQETRAVETPGEQPEEE